MLVWIRRTMISKNFFGAYYGRSSPCEPSPCITIRAFRDGMVHQHTAVVDNYGKYWRRFVLGFTARSPYSAVYFLAQDESQLRFCESRIKQMPVPVLKRRGVISNDGELVRLIPLQDTTLA